jgi:hypothetical protein
MTAEKPIGHANPHPIFNRSAIHFNVIVVSCRNRRVISDFV